MKLCQNIYLNVRLTSIQCYKGPVAKERNLNIFFIRLKIVTKKNDGGPTDLFHQS